MFSINISITSESSGNQELVAADTSLLKALVEINEKLIERFGSEGDLEKNIFFAEESGDLFAWAESCLNGEKNTYSRLLDLSDPFETFEQAKMRVVFSKK